MVINQLEYGLRISCRLVLKDSVGCFAGSRKKRREQDGFSMSNTWQMQKSVFNPDEWTPSFSQNCPLKPKG